ncbi:MAG: EpsG family protein [Clostridia bacterium]|nr:EpsG family protein [Clostridia bacterium]
MIVYLAVAVFPLLMAQLYNLTYQRGKAQGVSIDKKQPGKWGYLFVAALPMFFLIGFRNQYIGPDTNEYIRNFQVLCDTPWNRIFDISRMEDGYMLFVKIITIFTDSPLIYQVICATIYWIAITDFSSQLDDENFLFLFLFATLGIYTFMFTGTRQNLAMCICLLSFRFIKNRKIIPFAILITIAYFFHKSSILFISAYIIYARKLNFLNVLIYVVIMVVCVMFLDFFQEWLNEQLEYEYEIEETEGGWVFSVLMVGITLYSLISLGMNGGFTKKNVGFFNVGIIATIFWILRLFTRVAERPSYYFMPFAMAALAGAVACIQNKDEKRITKMVVIVVGLLLYAYRFYTALSPYVPYKFFVL